ncbi:MAG: hypothetical protein PSV40_04700 [Polaromonas sp.]|uniref:hypothetical protein n=1 Tax=Polaromonas sp. TaxID=1869339 RepID=UPI0024894FD7|nr:hypothetical protein [Polaromonas sp.]MDI1268387.1 hypothetical protein [Polaromonas sp.]
MAMLSGCALAHAENAVYAFPPANPDDIHLPVAWNLTTQRVSSAQWGRVVSLPAVLPVGRGRPALSNCQ